MVYTQDTTHIKMLEILMKMKMVLGRVLHIYISTDCTSGSYEKLDKLSKNTIVTNLQNSEWNGDRFMDCFQRISKFGRFKLGPT